MNSLVKSKQGHLAVSILIGVTLLLMSSGVYSGPATVEHVYELNNSFADALDGPALVPAGGTPNPMDYSQRRQV